MLRSLDTQKPHNFASAHSNDVIAVGVINMEGDSGHKIAEKCARDLKSNFNGNEWGNNGPSVLTRVLNKICESFDVNEMINTDKCKIFQVLPVEECYAIQWNEYEMFFKEEYLDETLRRLSGKLVAHVFSSNSAKIPLSKFENVAYIHLAKKYCPKTYSACDTF